MDIFIFNKELQFLGLMDTFTSLIWRRKYYSSGSFELQCSFTPTNLLLLKEHNIVYKKDDDEAGFIETINIKQDNEGKEILSIKGKFLTSYLNRRIIWETQTYDTTVENVMRTFVTDSCITPKIIDRKIPNLKLGTLNNFKEKVNCQIYYNNLAEELQDLSTTSNIGHKINLDIKTKTLIFNVYKGLDRSVNQSINPFCIFSNEFDNILEQEYTYSFNNYRNVALVLGMEQGTTTKTKKNEIVGTGIGINRFEMFVDAGDILDTKTTLRPPRDPIVKPIPDAEYKLLIRNRGNEKLSESKEIFNFDGKIDMNSSLKYKTDYDLGDIITYVSKKWGVTLDLQITEIEEVYEKEGQSINIIFGNKIPTLVDKIKQKIK